MIAVDWGTSSLRAYRLGVDGAVLDQRSAASGIRACNGEFEAVLVQLLAGWDDPLIVMAGMIGSRSGWVEVPYVAAPAGLDEVAAGLHEFSAAGLPGRSLFIAPGLAHRPADSAPDVMRGEETQLFGLVDQLPGAGPHTLCLPGTHSKWVHVEQGRIAAFHTAMTGELFALLTQHSLLAVLMQVDAADDEAAFARGVHASTTAGGFLNHLFGVRSLGLFDSLPADAAASYLSGLLIGHELLGLAEAGRSVHLIGGAGLTRRYERALAARGIEAIAHAESLTARGLFRLAQARGLLA